MNETCNGMIGPNSSSIMLCKNQSLHQLRLNNHEERHCAYEIANSSREIFNYNHYSRRLNLNTSSSLRSLQTQHGSVDGCSLSCVINRRYHKPPWPHIGHRRILPGSQEESGRDRFGTHLLQPRWDGIFCNQVTELVEHPSLYQKSQAAGRARYNGNYWSRRWYGVHFIFVWFNSSKPRRSVLVGYLRGLFQWIGLER